MTFVQVAETENDDAIELPAEDDGTLLLSTVTAQFPGACGLKYRSPETGGVRGVRLQDGKLYAPDCVWGSQLFCIAYPKENKRKGEETQEDSNARAKKPVTANTRPRGTTDLIVLGLPYTCEKDEVQQYFEQYGELLMVEVKKDPKTYKSKGFGFVRFANIDAQERCLSQRHMIGGRWCDVKVPNSKDGAQPQVSRKVFIGRCTEDITAEDLRSYFSQFGEVVDVFIPKQFRSFAFVTFADPMVAQGLCGEDHIIKNTSVHVGTAEPKKSDKRSGGSDDGPIAGGGQANHGSPSTGPAGRSSMGGQQQQHGGGGSMADSGMANNPMAMAFSSMPGLAPAVLAAALASQGFGNIFGMPPFAGGVNPMGGAGGSGGGGQPASQQQQQGGPSSATLPPSAAAVAGQHSFPSMYGGGSGGSGGPVPPSSAPGGHGGASGGGGGGGYHWGHGSHQQPARMDDRPAMHHNGWGGGGGGSSWGN